jgi:hypothetical protein
LYLLIKTGISEDTVSGWMGSPQADVKTSLTRDRHLSRNPQQSRNRVFASPDCRIIDLAEVEMYRVDMDRGAQDDVTAAVAAHRELGSDYNSAIAEGLVERIGAEIDKRVDARFASNERGRGRRAEMTPADQRRTLWVGIGIGSAGACIPALLTAVLVRQGSHSGAAALGALLVFWAVLFVIYVVTGLVRHARSQDRAVRIEASRDTRP